MTSIFPPFENYTKGILVFGYRKAMPAMSTHPLASIKPENQSVSSISILLGVMLPVHQIIEKRENPFHLALACPISRIIPPKCSQKLRYQKY